MAAINNNVKSTIFERRCCKQTVIATEVCEIGHFANGQHCCRGRLFIGGSYSLLSLSKVAGLFVPVILGQAVDMVSEEAFALPMILGLLVAYGALRVGEQLFSEGREYIFARVAQRTIRSVGVRVFDHLHSLSLRFHLDRQTGGLSRIIERGTKAIEFLLTFMLFNIVPMAIELLLVCAVLWSLYDVSFAVVTLLVITIYQMHLLRRVLAPSLTLG